MRVYLPAASAFIVLAAAGCGPSVAYFAPTDPSGRAEITRGGISFTISADNKGDHVKVDVGPSQVAVTEGEDGQEWATAFVPVMVLNRSKQPVTLKSAEAALKADFAESRKPFDVKRQKQGTGDAVPAGGTETWYLYFRAGGPDALDGLKEYRLALPLAVSDKTHTVAVDFKRYYPYRYRPYYYGWGHYPFWFGLHFPHVRFHLGHHYYGRRFRYGWWW